MTITNELFPGYLIQYRILFIHFFSNILIRFLSSLEILADRLNASNPAALILFLSSSYKL